MPEVLSVADRVEVLRLGRRVASFTAADTSIEELVGAMTGSLDDPAANGNGAADGGKTA
jgi:simple sugar transport system ATP-binding protein